VCVYTRDRYACTKLVDAPLGIEGLRTTKFSPTPKKQFRSEPRAENQKQKT